MDPCCIRLGVWIPLAVGTLKMHRWQGSVESRLCLFPLCIW